MKHRLKIWPNYYNAVTSGLKTFEVRIDDRDYKVGDILELEEWDPSTKEFTGRPILVRRITYIARGLGAFGLDNRIAVMAMKKLGFFEGIACHPMRTNVRQHLASALLI